MGALHYAERRLSVANVLGECASFCLALARSDRQDCDGSVSTVEGENLPRVDAQDLPWVGFGLSLLLNMNERSLGLGDYD